MPASLSAPTSAAAPPLLVTTAKATPVLGTSHAVERNVPRPAPAGRLVARPDPALRAEAFGVLAVFTALSAVLGMAAAMRYEFAVPVAPDEPPPREWLLRALCGR